MTPHVRAPCILHWIGVSGEGNSTEYVWSSGENKSVPGRAVNIHQSRHVTSLDAHTTDQVRCLLRWRRRRIAQLETGKTSPRTFCRGVAEKQGAMFPGSSPGS